MRACTNSRWNRFPIVADLVMKVATLFGTIHSASSDTSAVRAVFFIDPQTVDKRGMACPADWRPGKPATVPPPDWHLSKKNV